MNLLSTLYGHSLSLLTDLYQLTMAYGYWKSGAAEKQAVFNLFFRKNPFDGGFAIACGLEHVIDYLDRFRFDESDLDYLRSLTGNDDKPLFEEEFLEHLRELKFSCDVDAIPEGTAVFPSEPLVRVIGPLIQCQLLETPLLNLINFQTLIATKSARICMATQGEPVLEFGLRRAQGIDGGLAASRAAYAGGCVGTSNVLAGKLFGIPIKGTHAHSWIMTFDDELEAFEAYAEAMPNNCVFLVDTYDTIEGVRKAVEVGRKLRERGFEMVGIRLDSGDLAGLSIEARKILDEAGFPNAGIVASNDLDEHLVTELKEQGAAIDIWGIGTRLATAFDQPALGGVYKLTAVRRPSEDWQYRVKLSNEPIKVSNPGIQQVRRFESEDGFLADVIFDTRQGIGDGCRMFELSDSSRQMEIPAGTPFEDLLVPVLRKGELVYEKPALSDIRLRTLAQLAKLPEGTKLLKKASSYPVGLEEGFFSLKSKLIELAEGRTS